MSYMSGSGGMHDSHAVFNRFWRHYEASMEWMRSHYVTVSRINDELAAETADSARRNDESVRQKSPRGPSNSKRRRFHSSTVTTAPDISVDDSADDTMTMARIVHESAFPDPIHIDEDSEGGYDADQPDATAATELISDEVLDFFETSRRHREQRDFETSQRHYENLENLMISSRPSAVNTGADTSAVFEAHQLEMRALYGSQAATIHGMEMAMQCGFERFAHADVKLWPNIPMRI